MLKNILVLSRVVTSCHKSSLKTQILKIIEKQINKEKT